MAFDQFSERQRCVDRRFSARLHHRLRQTTRRALLAIEEKEIGQLRLSRAVDDIRRRRAVRAHAHVERAVLLEGKPPPRLIDLHGGDADIEHHPGERLIDKIGDVAKAAFNDLQPVAIDRRPFAAPRHRLRIAVDSDHFIRPSLQKRDGVAARVEGAVKKGSAPRRITRLQHFGQQHRRVQRPGLRQRRPRRVGHQ